MFYVDVFSSSHGDMCSMYSINPVNKIIFYPLFHLHCAGPKCINSNEARTTPLRSSESSQGEKITNQCGEGSNKYLRTVKGMNKLAVRLPKAGEI